MNFNSALPAAAAIAWKHLGQHQKNVYLVRDLFGKIRVVLPKEETGPQDALGNELKEKLCEYTYDRRSCFLREDDVQHILETARAVPGSEDGSSVFVLDRQITANEWNAIPPPPHSGPKRFTFYSMKGGVGRSTAVAILAWHLAEQGKRVLIVDLDLESPGIGTTLLGESLPIWGVVDWFVEDVLGNGNAILESMVAESGIQDFSDNGGRIAVVPAFGSETGDYFAKLGRAYLERGPEGQETWPKRLGRMLVSLEAIEKPDVVLLDSRTGLHDTSAALVLAMGAETFMFAADTPQTWADYAQLFSHWKQHPKLNEFRRKLWMIGSMLPRKDPEARMAAMADSAWNLFSRYIYDAEIPESADDSFKDDAYRFSAANKAANHFPKPIIWDEALYLFNPLSDFQKDAARLACKGFLEWFENTFMAQNQDEEDP